MEKWESILRAKVLARKVQLENKEEKAKKENDNNQRVLAGLSKSVYVLMLSVIDKAQDTYADEQERKEHYHVLVTTLSANWRAARDAAMAQKRMAEVMQHTVKLEALHDIEQAMQC